MLVPNLARTPGARQISLAQIEAVVSAYLGPSRVPGNAQPAAFNRQVAMYLAKHIGGWSTTKIGKFYNGRDHSTVCYAIQRIEAMRESHPDVDGLLTILREQIAASAVGWEDGRMDLLERPSIVLARRPITEEFLDALADRLVNRILARIREPSPGRATHM
jgi:hypothetical protein